MKTYIHLLVVSSWFVISCCYGLRKRASQVAIIATLWGPLLPKVVPAYAVNNIIGPSSGVGVDSSGLFNLCPASKPLPRCVSSQDDRPSNFQAPWLYEGDFVLAKNKLLGYIKSKYNGAKVVDESEGEGRYFQVDLPVRGSDGQLEDFLEFYFTPGDNLIQFRGERRFIGQHGEEVSVPFSDFGANAGIMEAIRVGCRLESVPVLRNRERALFFIESPFDSFGPSTSDLNQIY